MTSHIWLSYFKISTKIFRKNNPSLWIHIMQVYDSWPEAMAFIVKSNVKKKNYYTHLSFCFRRHWFINWGRMHYMDSQRWVISLKIFVFLFFMQMLLQSGILKRVKTSVHLQTFENLSFIESWTLILLQYSLPWLIIFHYVSAKFTQHSLAQTP